jgi:hypothetical protein
LEHAALDGLVVFGLHVLEGGGLVAGLLFEVVVGDFDVAEFEGQSAGGVAEGGDFFLEDVLGAVGFFFGLFVLVLFIRCMLTIMPIISHSIPLVWRRRRN